MTAMICSCGNHIPLPRWELGLRCCAFCGEDKARAETARKFQGVAETHKGGFVYLGTDETKARQYAQDIAGMRAGTCGRTGGSNDYTPVSAQPRVKAGVPVATGVGDFLRNLATQTLARVAERRFTSRDAEAEFIRTVFWSALLTVRMLGHTELIVRLEAYHQMVVKHGRVGITLMQRDLT